MTVGNRYNFAARRRAVLKDAGSQAQVLLISHPPDVSYLSGFAGEDSMLLVSQDRATLITDGRYDEQARAECPDIDVHVRNGGLMAAAAEVLGQCKLTGKVALQSEYATLQARDALAKHIKPSRLIGLSQLVIKARQVKDDAEIRAIRKAIRVAEEAFRGLMAQGSRGVVGQTERELAAELEYRMRLAGAQGASFETIVAAGANASQPHYRPGDVPIEADQPVLIDWGARVDGYCSDLTRVVFTGKIPPKIAEIYEVVLRAQQAGIDAIRSGVAGRTPDRAARAVMDSAGFGDRFVHGLGHGIGREVHEYPVLAKSGKARLRSGMVTTVEPGIYLPGLGGVRIEDDVLVTPEGAKRLSTLGRSLKAMVLP